MLKSTLCVCARVCLQEAGARKNDGMKVSELRSCCYVLPGNFSSGRYAEADLKMNHLNPLCDFIYLFMLFILSVCQCTLC